jgi:aminoglycoside phosphotransferase (APT) family kinase protein
MTAFEFVQGDGQQQKLIARRPNDGVLARNPQAVADEFKLLQILQAEGIPGPSPYYLDQAGNIFVRPLLVTEYVEGETVFSPVELDGFISQQAIHLAHLHQIGQTRGKQWDLSFLPRAEAIYARRLQNRPAPMNDALGEGRVREVLETVWPVPQVNESVLLHGDFWLGNILWREGVLTAVIDWEDAAYGDPLADLAITRLEMLWMFDLQTMHNFTAHYQTLTDIDYGNQPYWDLGTVLRWGFRYIGDWVEGESAKQEIRDKQLLFFQQALDQLSIPYHG